MTVGHHRPLPPFSFRCWAASAVGISLPPPSRLIVPDRPVAAPVVVPLGDRAGSVFASSCYPETCSELLLPLLFGDAGVVLRLFWLFFKKAHMYEHTAEV